MLTVSRLRGLVLALSAMASLSLCGSTQANDGASFEWKKDDAAATADLYLGTQPVLRYVFAYDPSSPAKLHDTYKVFHHVYGPGTNQIITKGPGGKFTHHRGLYVGWNKTSFEGGRADFWHCTGGAHLRHIKFVEMTGDANQGRMTAEIHWNDNTGKPVIVENRSVTVRREAASKGWQIDWSTKLESRRGEISLEGDRQHAGFQFRADQPVADKESARFIRPAAFPQQPAAIQVGDGGNPPAHSDLGWFAMTYEIEGKRFNIEYFDNPSLPKPSLFSERPYGRFGTFFKTTLTPEKPLEMKYRVIVSAGDAPTVESIQTRYQQFLSDLKK